MGPYGVVVVLLFALILTIALVYGIGMVLAPIRTPLAGAPLLSGHAPVEHALSRYHVRWFAVMILFLAFDMEMIFMYPWAVVFADIGAKALLEMGMFLMILMLGILYAWREGALRWS